MECKDLQTQGMWSEGLGTSVMSKEEMMAVLRSFGMGKFAGAVMWVINEVFVGVNENDNKIGFVSPARRYEHRPLYCRRECNLIMGKDAGFCVVSKLVCGYQLT